jgi:hypothetical protein
MPVCLSNKKLKTYAAPMPRSACTSGSLRKASALADRRKRHVTGASPRK